jgi:hypothetical protein
VLPLFNSVVKPFAELQIGAEKHVDIELTQSAQLFSALFAHPLRTLRFGILSDECANTELVDKFNVARELFENNLKPSIECRQFRFAVNRQSQQVRIGYLLMTGNQLTKFSYRIAEGQIVRPKEVR